MRVFSCVSVLVSHSSFCQPYWIFSCFVTVSCVTLNIQNLDRNSKARRTKKKKNKKFIIQCSLVGLRFNRLNFVLKVNLRQDKEHFTVYLLAQGTWKYNHN